MFSCISYQFFTTIQSPKPGLVYGEARDIFQRTLISIDVPVFMLIYGYFGYLSWVSIKEAEDKEKYDREKYFNTNC